MEKLTDFRSFCLMRYMKESVSGEKESGIGRVISASGRFGPKEIIHFETPIVGKNGNKIISYEWSYEWTMLPNSEGEMVSKRISDWSHAEMSAETGRDLVHKFTVEKTDGSSFKVSSETIPHLLGYVNKGEMKLLPGLVSSVKTLAKQRMQLAIKEAQKKEYDKVKEVFIQSEKPPIVEIDEPVDFPSVQEDWKKGAHKVFAMGDVWMRQDNTYDYNSKGYIPIKTPTKETKMGLETDWINQKMKESGVTYPVGINELRNRIRRQEKKVEEITTSTIKIKTENG